jgi:hypothetical protein
MESNSSNNKSHQDFKKIFEFDENVVIKTKEDNTKSTDKKSSEKKIAEKTDPLKEDPFFLS